MTGSPNEALADFRAHLNLGSDLITGLAERIGAVLDLHQPCHEGPGNCPKCFPQGPIYRVCGTCRPGARYPCPTVRALTGADATTTTEDPTP